MSLKMTEDSAEHIYAKILKEVESLVGNKLTYALQLNGAGKKILGVKFKGVYTSDRIPQLNDLSPYCVLNLDKTGEPGSHWISLGKVAGENKSLMYDSYGRVHANIIPNIQFSGNGRIINSDTDSEQGKLETNCGARSLAFLILLDKYGWEVARLI